MSYPHGNEKSTYLLRETYYSVSEEKSLNYSPSLKRKKIRSQSKIDSCSLTF
jgi:hypothetical protein